MTVNNQAAEVKSLKAKLKTMADQLQESETLNQEHAQNLEKVKTDAKLELLNFKTQSKKQLELLEFEYNSVKL